MWEERRMTVATTHCSFYRFILDKREEFWNDGKSGMPYFSILRLSIKWQIIRDFNTPTTLKRTSNRPSCLWKRLTLHTHAQQEGMPKAQVVRADPPGMEEQDNASSAFMVDEWDRPMACVELLRMMKEKPATKCSIHTWFQFQWNEGGGRRKRR